MKTITWMKGFLACIPFSWVFIAAPSLASDVQAIEVGRTYYIEGELLRYVPDVDDWVAVVKDAPFSTGDTLFSGSKGMAEMIVPNGTRIRIGNNTQIQFISLEPDLAEIDVASGVARFYNKGSGTVIKTTTPFGYVLADPGTVFDFYVGADSAEVVALKGTVSFVHSTGDARYDVVAGSPSILADQNQVGPGDGIAEISWDRWNQTRERVWAAKLRENSRSAEYLPPSLRYEADCLDRNGRWEKVPYEGRECWFWRPTTVYVGWSPFTMGIWTEWCGDQTWIPAEPFGYVTHHYGNWVYIRNRWYWAPPVVSVRIGFPLLDIGFFWYPGRVSWIYRGTYVGWVPLSPHETYYSHHNWGGPHHKVAPKNSGVQINISLRNYTNSNHTVIVRKDHFRGVENYRDVRVTNIHPTIVHNYNAAPVINNTVINNYTENRQRHNYTNTPVNEKPRNTAVGRIQQNIAAIQKDRKEDATAVKQQVNRIPDGKINRETRIQAPRVTNYMLPANDVKRIKSETNLQQREINTSGAPPTTSAQQQKIVIKPDQVANAITILKERSAAQTERVSPTTTQQQKTVTQPRQATTATTVQRQKSTTQSERVSPTTTTQKQKTVTQPKQVTPSTTAEQGADKWQKVKELVYEYNQRKLREKDN